MHTHSNSLPNKQHKNRIFEIIVIRMKYTFNRIGKKRLSNSNIMSRKREKKKPKKKKVLSLFYFCS